MGGIDAEAFTTDHTDFEPRYLVCCSESCGSVRVCEFNRKAQTDSQRRLNRGVRGIFPEKADRDEREQERRDRKNLFFRCA